MLFLQWKCESIDDRAKNFEEFRYSIESLCLIDKLKEYVVDRPSDIRSEVQKLSVNTMQRSFQKISFARILRVE